MFYFIASSSFVIQEIATFFVTKLKDSQIKELLVLSNCDYFVTILLYLPTKVWETLTSTTHFEMGNKWNPLCE